MSKTKTLKCPKCGSISVEALETKKKFSKGKAVVGAAMTAPLAGVTAPIGLLAGFVGKKGKTKCHCLECGHIFEIKL